MARSNISKLNAAHRQLETAVILYFTGGDPVSVHTLVHAAFRILRDLAKKKGSIVHTHFEDWIAPGAHSKLWKALGKWANFFKHADEDPDDILTDFNEESSLYSVLLCAFYLVEFKFELSPDLRAFLSWMQIRHPDVVRDSSASANDVKAASRLFRRLESKGRLEMGQLLIKNARMDFNRQRKVPIRLKISTRPKILLPYLYPPRSGD